MKLIFEDAKEGETPLSFAIDTIQVEELLKSKELIRRFESKYEETRKYGSALGYWWNRRTTVALQNTIRAGISGLVAETTSNLVS
jgi:hypothetical protein